MLLLEHSFHEYFATAIQHQIEHKCTGVPFESGRLLMSSAEETKPKQILELGTGIGYSTACFAVGYKQSHIDTIDHNLIHMELAKRYWQELEINERISMYTDKAEVILPRLHGPYDLIFFDGDAPSMKFLIQFERLLRSDGLLITANLFLKDPKGGVYLRHIKNKKKWATRISGDTALSVRTY